MGLLLNENFDDLPQWVLLIGLKETMWSKEGLEVIISTLGVPLEAEYTATPWGHGLGVCVMLEFTEEFSSRISVITSRGGHEVKSRWSISLCHNHAEAIGALGTLRETARNL